MLKFFTGKTTKKEAEKVGKFLSNFKFGAHYNPKLIERNVTMNTHSVLYINTEKNAILIQNPEVTKRKSPMVIDK